MAGTLTHSPADVIRRLFINLGYGTELPDELSWPIVVASEPDSPDDCITITDTTGTQGGRFMKGGEIQEMEGIQVRIRSLSDTDGFTKADQIKRLMDSGIYYNTVDIDTTRYTVYSISRKGNVLSLGREVSSSQRSLFTINAVVSLRQV